MARYLSRRRPRGPEEAMAAGRLPLYTGLSEADVDRIVAAVTSFRTEA